MKKNCLVSGCTGFIGSHLTNELTKRGYKVTGIDIRTGFIKDLKLKEFILRDIRNNLEDLKSNNFDTIFHLAAKRSVIESFDNPENYISTNIWGTSNLLDTFNESRFINISSSAAASCKSIYGISKRASERVASLHKDSVSIRLFNVFGERQLDLTMAIPAFIYHIKHGTTATIYGDGSILRDYIYVSDVVDEIIKIGEGKRRGITEAGYGSPIKIYDLYKLLCSVSKKNGKLKFASPRHGDPKKTCAKYTIEEPLFGFSEGIRRTVRHYLKDKSY